MKDAMKTYKKRLDSKSKYNKIESPIFSQIKTIKKAMKQGYIPKQSISEYINDRLQERIKSQDDMIKFVQSVDFVGSSITIYLLENKSVHYFIENKELYDFLCKTEIKDINFTKSIVDITNIDSNLLKSDDGDNVHCFVGHVHYKSKESALSFMFIKTAKTDLITLYLMRNEDIVMYKEDFNIKYIYSNNLGNEDYPNEKIIQDTNLIINMFLYADAFPESIIDGTPDEYISVYNYAKNKTYKTHESLLENPGVTPHFRRGHFRHLDSEFYTKKRGQVVFVNSTFVKGKAKTVIDNEERVIA